MNNRIVAPYVQFLLGLLNERFLKKALCFIFVSFFCSTLSLAQTFQTKAPQALLLDFNTGTILFSKAEHTKIPPASLAKLMTMEVIFKRLKDGNLSLNDKFLVSEDSWKRGGSS